MFHKLYWLVAFALVLGVSAVSAQETDIGLVAGAILTDGEQDSFLSQRGEIIVAPEEDSALSQISELFAPLLEEIDGAYNLEAATLRYIFHPDGESYKAFPYLIVDRAVEVGLDGIQLHLEANSIIYLRDNNSFAYLQPLAVTDGQTALPGMVVVNDRLHDFLVIFADSLDNSTRIPEVGELILLYYLPSPSVNVIYPYALLGTEANGHLEIYNIYDLGVVPPIPASPSGDMEGQLPPVVDSSEAIRLMQERNAIDLVNYNGQEYPNNPFPVRLDSMIQYEGWSITIDGVSYERNRGTANSYYSDGIIPTDVGLRANELGRLSIGGTYAGILGQRTLHDLDLYGPYGPIPEFHRDEVVVIDHLLVIEVRGRVYRFVFSTLSDLVIFGYSGQTIDQVVPTPDMISQLSVGRQIGIAHMYLVAPVESFVWWTTYSTPRPELTDYGYAHLGTFLVIDRYDRDILLIQEGSPPTSDIYYLGVIGNVTSMYRGD